MQTTGAALLATKRCSLVRVLVAVHDGRNAHGLPYLTAVLRLPHPLISPAWRHPLTTVARWSSSSLRGLYWRGPVDGADTGGGKPGAGSCSAGSRQQLPGGDQVLGDVA